jgi:hypothetical protein
MKDYDKDKVADMVLAGVPVAIGQKPTLSLQD